MKSEIGDGLLDYMIKISCQTIYKYDDKFFALSNGLINIEDYFR